MVVCHFWSEHDLPSCVPHPSHISGARENNTSRSPKSVITFGNIQTDFVGEPSAIDTDTALVGACVCRCEPGDVNLEVFGLWVVGDGDSVSVAWSSVAAGGGNGSAARARFPAPILSVVSVHAGGRVEAFHSNRAVEQTIDLPWSEHGARDCKRKSCWL